MRTLESILKQIQERKYPYFKLYVRRGYNDDLIDANFDLKDTTVEVTAKILSDLVASYANEPATLFAIELAKTPSSNQSSKTDKIPFVVDVDAYTQAKAQSVAGQPLNQSVVSGLQGLQQSTQNLFNERLALEKEISAKEKELLKRELSLEAKEREFERDKKQFEEDVKATKEDLQEKEKTFSSRSAQVENALGNILGRFIATQNPIDAPGQAALAGAAAPSEEPRTPEELAIESIALNIDANVTDMLDIKAIGLLVQSYIDNPAAFQDYRDRAKTVKFRVA